MSEKQNNELWAPIGLDNWQQVLHIKNKIATEEDVIEGRAVFYIAPNNSPHEPLNISIPSIAYYFDEETNERKMVVIIQAEKANDQELVGIRYLDGGNGICLLKELEVITN